jgi:hypothetical protein
MYLPAPPTIPGSINTKTSFASQVQTSELIVNNTLALFGTTETGQQNVFPTYSSIIDVLQGLGLVSEVNHFVQQGTKLIGTGYDGLGTQGSSVALSADGSTLAIGAPNDNGSFGATWVFVRDTVGAWSQQGPKLVGSSSGGGLSYQGTSVALSADGNVLVIGGPGENSGIGAAWIFTRFAGTWTENQLISGSGYTGTDVRQGFSVAISADASTIALGGPLDNTGIGATWIFAAGEGYFQQAMLIASDSIGTDVEQGSSVSLSYNGSTLAVGGLFDDTGVGATWIYNRDGFGAWTQTTKLVGTGYIGTDIEQGTSVALSSNGTTLAVGGPDDNNGFGATWIFTQDTAGTWSQQGSKLIGSGYTGTSGSVNQGHAVALSQYGSLLVVGGPLDDYGIGACWAFTRDTGGSWSQSGTKLVGSDYTGASVQQGFSIALSSDGLTMATGGPQDNNGFGATWVFAWYE